MTYSKITPKAYAKLRTQPEHIRQEYEQRANKTLKETVAKEQAHFQKQVDEFKEFAQGEIDKAWEQAEHWQSEIEIKKEREKYRAEIERLEREVEKLKREKARRNKAKRIIERD